MSLPVPGAQPTAGQDYTLQLSLDNPGNDAIKGWALDWGDGTVVRGNGPTLPAFTHAYRVSGASYGVSLTVFTDDQALNDTTVLTTAGTPPDSGPSPAGADLQFDQQHPVTEGTDAAAFFFYDGFANSYTFNWGDGSMPQTISTGNIGSVYPPHIYAEQGRYWATINGSDGSMVGCWFQVDDESGSRTMVPIPDQIVAVGQPVDVSTNFSGLDGDGPVQAYIDWGDGHGFIPALATINSDGTGTATAHLAHAPAGDHAVTLAVYDEQGRVADTTFLLSSRYVQLTIDSDNNDGIDNPLFTATPEEQAIKNLSGLPGKLVQVDNGDVNRDGIPDFAEFDLSRAVTPTHFVPLIVAVSIDIDLSTAHITVTYDGQSPPSAVVAPTSPGGTYYISNGNLRLWTKDASEARNPATVGNGGDYIYSGQSFPASVLFGANPPILLNQAYQATIWVEAVYPDATPGAHEITVSVSTPNPNGGSPIVVSDAVRATCASLQMSSDTNGDGTITLDGRDFSAPADPFRFWLNDNTDGYSYSAKEFGGGAVSVEGGQLPDSLTPMIGSKIGVDAPVLVVSPIVTVTPGIGTIAPSPALIAERETEVFRRDLEDFAQVGLDYSSTVAGVADSVVIEISGASNPNMSLRLWRSAIDPAKAFAYDAASATYRFYATDQLTNPTAADAIMNVTQNALNDNPNSFRGVFADAPLVLPIATFEQYFGAKTIGNDHVFQLMFEGVTAGAGKVNITFMHAGSVVATSGFYLDLHPVTDLYEHYSVSTGSGVGPNGDATADPGITPIPTTPTLVGGASAGSYATTKDYFLYVHGWNMDATERMLYAATAYKRMYWQGFRGTFGLYDWPTQFTSDPTSDPGNYNRSEEVAWNSAAGLRSLLGSLQIYRQAGGKLAVLSHSMGNIVTSEALNLAGSTKVVDTAIFSQAAASSEFYYGSGFDTDLYSAFGTQVGGASPRFANINRAATKLVNFANPNDYALHAWELNDMVKPDGPGHDLVGTSGIAAQAGFGGLIYDATTLPPTITVTRPGGLPTALVLGPDTYEMFANGLYTHGQAMGALPVAVGPFTGFVDLSKPPYNFGFSRIDHSGQFNHSTIEMTSYWKEVMQQTGIH